MPKQIRLLLPILLLTLVFNQTATNSFAAKEAEKPNVVLVMADDMGWGQTGYYNHPVLKTPNLDKMADHGLRFDRFYAGAQVCSPTRASVLTGRNNMRTGVDSHGYALRHQEKTLAEAMKKAGYATGHFGKWHLNGMRGPGAPILKDDPFRPGAFGFEEWLSVTNFFDYDPLMSRNGDFQQFHGDSSEIIVDQALKFIRKQAQSNQPTLTVIWYGTPHSPFKAADKDTKPFRDLNEASTNHYGELVAMDRSLGTLREGLREAGIANNTLVWFCSDNGGLPRIEPDTVGGLRGHKGTVYEGGLRVPCVLEWPEGIPAPRITQYPACTMDIFPTIAEIVGLPDDSMLKPRDGLSLVELFEKEKTKREKPIGFYCLNDIAMLDNDHKMIYLNRNRKQTKIEFYNLAEDPHEENNLYSKDSEEALQMKRKLDRWVASVEKSVAGKDYPSGKVDPDHPEPRRWYHLEEYEPYLDEWKDRWEFQRYLKK